MSEQPWRERVAAYIREQARPVEKFGHQPRLYALTRQIGADQHYDDDIVYAAAWLHDLGVFEGHRPTELAELERWDSVAYSVDRVPALLREFGFPEAKIPAVLECIRTHQPQFETSTIEAAILRDADILEQLGAIGILRTVCKVGRDTRFATFTDAVRSLTHAAETLPPMLRLPASRLLAEECVRLHRAFLAGIIDEAGSHLY